MRSKKGWVPVAEAPESRIKHLEAQNEQLKKSIEILTNQLHKTESEPHYVPVETYQRWFLSVLHTLLKGTFTQENMVYLLSNLISKFESEGKTLDELIAENKENDNDSAS